MKRALFLAKKGGGFSAPNPLVGCVLVRDGNIIAEGWHKAYGDIHAEAMALERAGSTAKDSHLYVNLEPCYGYWPRKHNPPCVDAIIKSKVGAVSIAHTDPHPEVSGRGIDALRAAGIKVDVGLCEEDARKLNESYLYVAKNRRVFVHLKAAVSLDGKICSKSGDSRWISSGAARRDAHRLRSCHMAILVGSNTLLRDNPLLTVRHIPGPNPLRIVLDSKFRCHPDSIFAKQAIDGKSLLVTHQTAKSPHEQTLGDRGVRVLRLPFEGEKNLLSLQELLQWLFEKGITTLLVEGGQAILTDFFQQNYWQKATFYLNPLFLGSEGLSLMGALNISTMAQTLRYPINWQRKGDSMRAEIYNTDCNV